MRKQQVAFQFFVNDDTPGGNLYMKRSIEMHLSKT